MAKKSLHFFLALLGPHWAMAEDAQTPSQADELAPVLISATRTERRALDLPGTASAIDAETMERRLNRTIKDLVRYEPGVYAQNDPLRFGLAGFNIRGVGGNRVQMLVDGVRIPDAFSLGTFQSARRNRVDMDALKAVEIVRGAGSALYGSDGLGGVVSFVTKDPRDYLGTFGKSHYESLKLQYGQAADSSTQTAVMAGATGDFESLLLLTHAAGSETENRGADKSKSSARTAPNPQDTRTLNLLAKSLYRFDADNALRLTGEAVQDQAHTDARHLYGLNYAGRDVYRFFTHDRQSRWRASLDQSVQNLGFAWLDSLNWRLYGQVSRTRQRTDERRTSLLGQNQQVGRLFSYDQRMVGGEIRGAVEFALGSSRHRAVYGMEAFHSRVEELREGFLADLDSGETSNAVTPDMFPVRDFPLSETWRVGAFWQDEIGLLDKRVELLPALRFDYFSLRPETDAIYAKDNKGNPPVEQDAAAFSPKFGALFHLSDAFTLHGQYAEGFRAPNFADANSGFVNFAFGYASVPNPSLGPETSEGGEVGLRFENEAAYADAVFFRNDYRGFIQSEIACDPSKAAACPPFGLLTYKTVNADETVRIQGFEFKGEARLGRLWPALRGLSVLGSYALAEGRNLGDGKPVSSVNPMRGILGLRYDAPAGNWGAEAMLTLAAPKRERDIDFERAGSVFPTAGYGTVDLVAHCRYADRATLNVGIFNLLDKKYIEWEDARGRGADPHAGLGAPVDIRDRYTRPGRNLGVSLRMEF
jgi:hemoglobin/transferrin/lactoferrin receptor protein